MRRLALLAIFVPLAAGSGAYLHRLYQEIGAAQGTCWRYEPKEDITAYELAMIMRNTAGNLRDARFHVDMNDQKLMESWHKYGRHFVPIACATSDGNNT